LSRVENGHVTPTSRTLVRIAGALNVPVAAFFGGTEPLEAGDRCPVSLSGRCILDHLFAGLGPHTKQGFEDYTAAQLESLRQCNYLLHEGSADVRRTLVTLLKSLVAHDETTRRSAKKTLAGD
jgi:transcriptional regulator with XRE-family HTH domain